MINPMGLEGRNIIVTGASSGIGKDTACFLSKLGARIVLVGRDIGRLNECCNLLEGEGHRIEAFDLSAVDDIPQWIKKIAEEMGPLNGLVHSAGIYLIRPLRATSRRNFEDLMHINVTAAFCLVKGFRQKGVFAQNSSVVFLSSVMGMVGQPGLAAYCSSKGALIALAKSLALELAKDKIRVNCVCPGNVETNMAEKLRETLTSEQFDAIESMHPLGMGTTEDIANAIAFLLADTGRWITGSSLVVDGGYTAH